MPLEQMVHISLGSNPMQPAFEPLPGLCFPAPVKYGIITSIPSLGLVRTLYREKTYPRSKNNPTLYLQILTLSVGPSQQYAHQAKNNIWEIEKDPSSRLVFLFYFSDFPPMEDRNVARIRSFSSNVNSKRARHPSQFSSWKVEAAYRSTPT